MPPAAWPFELPFLSEDASVDAVRALSVSSDGVARLRMQQPAAAAKRPMVRTDRRGMYSTVECTNGD